MLPYVGIVPLFLLFEFTLGQNVPLRGPPQFETNPQYLDSYIPASMQVIAYLTEMMKYDIIPTVTTTTTHRQTTTTTTRPTKRPIIIQLTTKRPLLAAPPTPYHKPALYAPAYIISRIQSPLAGDETSNVASYEQYVNRLKNPSADYFDRYYKHADSISSIIDQLNRQRRATKFNYTTVATKKYTRNDVPDARRVRSVVEEVEEASNSILQRKIRAEPFTPAKANNNVVQQNNRQQFRSMKNSRAQPAEKKPELNRSRSVRSVVEEVPNEYEIKTDTINKGEALVDKKTISVGGLNSPAEDIIVGKAPSMMIDVKKAPLQVTVSSDTNKAKGGRALSINGDNFNARSVDYLGFGLNELIKQIQSERESIANQLSDDERVKLFSEKYDDVNFASYLLRQKKVPPTKAYVTLLSLYDLLNKESKKLMLNKYNGYASVIVDELIETSSGTSSEQLRIILQRIVDRPDTNDPTIRSKIASLVTDLSTASSYINDALRYIPPLPFSR